MHTQVVDSRIIGALRTVASNDPEFAYFASSAILQLTASETCRPLVGSIPSIRVVFNAVLIILGLLQSAAGSLQVAQQDICSLFERLLRAPGEASKLPMAQALRNLAGCKECRQCIVDQGAVQILMSLSESSDEETQKACSDAMSFLSEFTNLQEGAVDVLLKTSPAQQLHSAFKPSGCLLACLDKLRVAAGARSVVRVTRADSFFNRIDRHSIIGTNSPAPPSSPRHLPKQVEPKQPIAPTVGDGPPLTGRDSPCLDFEWDAIELMSAGGVSNDKRCALLRLNYLTDCLRWREAQAPEIDVFVEHSVVSQPPMNSAIAEIEIEPIPMQMDPYPKFLTTYELGSLSKWLLQSSDSGAPPPPMEQEAPPEPPTAKPMRSPGARSRFLKRFSRNTLQKSSNNLLALTG